MKKKKKIIIGVSLAAVTAIAAFSFFGKKPQVQAPILETIPLSKSSLTSTVGTSGTVQSADSVNVYTDLTYTVKSVPVKVGDKVSKGQVLCELDSKDLIDTIAQKQSAININSKQSAQKIEASQKKYNDTKNNVDAGLHEQLNAAQERVDTSKSALEDAQKKQADAEKHLKENLNTQLIAAKQSVESAKIALDSAQSKYNDVKKHKKDDDYPETDDVVDELYLRPAREAYNTAKLNYDTALKNLNALNTQVDEERENLAKATQTAQDNYNNAVKSLKALQVTINQDLENTLKGIETDKLLSDDTTAKMELQSLQDKLSKCKVISPVSGTITAVYVKKGSPANGLLFVIEDVGALKLTVKIKEFDIANVKVGMPATITSNSINGKEFKGQLQSISPTAVKDPEGKTASSSTAEFEADVLVLDENTGLRIGMNADAKIITEKKDDVFSVTYDTVTTDAQGKDIIYAAKPSKDGKYTAQALPVNLGIETDSEIEISGDGLKDGLLIISDSKKIIPGITFQTKNAKPAVPAAANTLKHPAVVGGEK